MTTSDVLVDAYGRIAEEVASVLDGISPEVLAWRPDPQANSIAWLIWHLARVQDDHLASAFERLQVWHEGGWVDRFGLPFAPEEIGYGQGPEDVGRVRPDPGLLRGYLDAVAARNAELVAAVTDDDLDRIVDERWDPPVTLAVRLVSVIADALQHVGQAAYVKGLAARAGVGAA